MISYTSCLVDQIPDGNEQILAALDANLSISNKFKIKNQQQFQF